MYSNTTNTSAQRQRAFCKHCKKTATHCEAWCNKNPTGRFYGKPIDQVYTKREMSDYINGRDYGATRPVGSARTHRETNW